MRISDWSSDVCSSDLSGTVHQALFSISLDGNTGYATGAAGEILQTGDGGESWKTMKPAPTPLALLGVATRGGHTLAAGQKGDRKSVLQGKSVSGRVDLGVRWCINTNKDQIL